jgi:hypothetical protein
MVTKSDFRRTVATVAVLQQSTAHYAMNRAVLIHGVIIPQIVSSVVVSIYRLPAGNRFVMTVMETMPTLKPMRNSPTKSSMENETVYDPTQILWLLVALWSVTIPVSLYYLLESGD